MLCHASHPHADINIFECCLRAPAPAHGKPAIARLLLKNEALYVVRSQQVAPGRACDPMTRSQRSRQVWVEGCRGAFSTRS